MSLQRYATEYGITCDYPDCDGESLHHAYTMKDAIDVFRSNGWSIGKRCLCPKHSGKTNMEVSE